MIVASANTSIPFTPVWLRTRKDPPAFHLRGGSLLDRTAFEARLDGEFRAGEIYGFVLREIRIDGIRNLCSEDDAARLIDLINQADTPSEDGGETLTAEEKALVKGADDILAQHWPEYRAASEQIARRNAMLPTLAFCTFCTGWDNLADDAGPIPFARTALGEIAQESLVRVPHIMLHSAGVEAYRMLYGRGEEKNCAPPSKSSSPRKTSNSGGTSKKAG